MRSLGLGSMVLSGVVLAAACGGRIDAAPGAGADAGTASPSGAAPPPRPRPQEPEPEPEWLDSTCPRPGIVGTKDIEQVFSGPWKGPGPVQAACTPADLDAVRALLASSSSVPYAKLAGVVGPSCRACAFTKSGDTTWGPFVAFSDGTYRNAGACYAVRSGDACGRNAASLEICSRAMCDEAECGSAQALASCTREVTLPGGACEEFARGTQSSCRDLATLDAACGSVVGLISAVCGGDALDAGAP